MQQDQQLNKSKFFCRASIRQRMLAGLVLGGVGIFFVFFWLAAKGKIDLSLFINPCGFKQRYGLPCPTCGVTTSVTAFAAGRIIESFYIQPVGGLLCSLMVVSGFLALLTAVFGIYFCTLKHLLSGIKIKYIILALIIVVIAGWAVTLSRALAIKNG